MDDGLAGGRVAKRHGDVAQPAFMADAADGTACQAGIKFGLGPGEEGDQCGRIQPVAHTEIGRCGGVGKAVPRAHQLAVVAAIDAVTHQWAQLNRDAAVQLDSQIRNAASRIDFTRCNDGLCRTHIHTGLTGAAMRRNRCVSGQRQVGVDFAEKKPRPGIPVQQQRVFAAPAQSGFGGQRHFHHRRRIGKHAVAEGANLGFNPARQLLQSLAHDLVVITPQRIA